ncbi:MAG: hypothetical protein HQL15_10800, partial [Candidatus Omnitrophica bacterium]|nr:hypothetical protein [Candidatus Omnitrophota bacterium]
TMLVDIDYETKTSQIVVFDFQDKQKGIKDPRPLRVINVFAQTVTHNVAEGNVIARIDAQHWKAIHEYVEGLTQGQDHHREYPASLDANHHGIMMLAYDLGPMEVLSISRVTESAAGTVVDYVDVTDRKLGQYGQIGSIRFGPDGTLNEQYTGHALLPTTVGDGKEILSLVKEEQFTQVDKYHYNAVNVFDYREVFKRVGKNWFRSHTIEGLVEIVAGKDGFDFNRLMSIPQAAAVFNQFGITADTILLYTPVNTKMQLMADESKDEVIHQRDYRAYHDPLERKVFTTYYDKNGKLDRIVLGMKHDLLTGEILESLTITKDYKVWIESATVAAKELNAVGLSNQAKDIFNEKVQALALQRYGIDINKGLAALGITPETILTVVKDEEHVLNQNGISRHDRYRVLLPYDSAGHSLAVIYKNPRGVQNRIDVYARWMQSEEQASTLGPNVLSDLVVLHKDGVITEHANTPTIQEDNGKKVLVYKIEGAQS